MAHGLAPTISTKNLLDVVRGDGVTDKPTQLQKDWASAPLSDAASGPNLDEPAHNGTADPTAAVARSNDQRIDGLLIGSRWSDGNISYSTPDAPGDYQGGYFWDQDGDGISPQNEGFSQFSAQQTNALHFAFNADILGQSAGASGFAVEGFTNLTISFAGAGTGAATMRYANTSDAGTAYNFYPSTAATGGDGWFGPNTRTPDEGNYSWMTTLHEIGHGLGLKHGHETHTFGALPANVDSHEFSLMTYRSYIGSDAQFVYNETFGYPQTYMMFDIAALQYMYGADFTSNGGNTVYTWNPNTGESLINGAVALNPGGNRIFSTVWDGNGTDTYDLSNYTTNLSINLAPGGWCDFSVGSTFQNAYLGGGPNGGYARGHVFNSLLFNGDNRSLIENAIGGSAGDTLTGNDADNTFRGNGGNDTINGGGGTDTARFAGTWGTYTFQDQGGGSVRVIGPDGTDTLSSVERLQFDDQTVTWPPSGTVLAISAASANKAEGNGGGTTPFTFTVTRTGNTSGTSTVFWQVSSTSNPTVDASDFSGATSNTLTFIAGETSKTVTVNVVADTTVESNETFTVGLSNATGATINQQQVSATGTIQDDDAGPDDYADSLTDMTAPFGQITVDAVSTGNLETIADRDWFRMSLTAGKAYVIELKGQYSGNGTLEDPYLRVRNSSGATVAENDDIENAVIRDSRLTYSPGSSGTFYVEAGAFDDDYTGTYRVIVAENDTSRPRNDFNGDLRSDIFWRTNGGALAVWEMNGNQIGPADYVRNGNAVTGAPGSDWHLVGTDAMPADFDGDGKGDLLWWTDSGAVAIWKMDGSHINGADYTRVGSNAVGRPGSDWHIADTGDFDGNAKADILWRTDNGALAIWKMDGTQVSGADYIRLGQTAVGAPGTDWHILGVADFDGDAKGDILWQTDSGALALWEMDGTQIKAADYLRIGSSPVGRPGADWNIVGTGDFDGDGMADILWQTNGGALALWEMDGNQIKAADYLRIGGSAVGRPGADWHIAGTGDFNGDGRADILWRTDGGSLALWQMDGNQIGPASYLKIGQTNVGAPGTDWNIVQHQYDLL